MAKNKILILKLGYSETLDKEISETSSLGDVLRTTVLLHLYKNDHVTWVTDPKAFPLLYHNKFIDRTLPFNLSTVLQLEAEHFDTVINLEKVPGICALADKIKGWKKFGFRFNANTGEAEAYEKAQKALEITRDSDLKRSHGSSWQHALFEMVDAHWKGEEYVLGYKPKTKTKFDIGFNYEVGTKWKNKAWPRAYWDTLEKELSSFSISWQEGKGNLYDYMDWIHSCKTLITNDSLGLHLALAMKKKVIGMFGPTSVFEVETYNRAHFISATQKNYPCMPCYLPHCNNDTFCMEKISPKRVAKLARSLLK